MHTRQSLELRQQQQLALTPQLQQSIRFLQLSAQELEAEVAQALQENPLLEREEEYDIDAGATVAQEAAAVQEDRWLLNNAPSRRQAGNHEEAERPEAELPVTLRDHLCEQLRLTRASERDRALVGILIDELDDNGYLSSSLDEILAFLPSELEVERNELTAALRLLQSFDPLGIGAQSLSECLLLQLRRRNGEQPTLEQAQALEHAEVIAQHHLAVLATGNLNKLREILEIPMEQLRAAHALLLRLEPRPARNWSGDTAAYVTPDVVIRKVGQRWEAALNPAVVPRVRMNAVYAQVLAETQVSPELQVQLQQAQGLVKSVHQRFVTILRVAQAIVDQQTAYLEQGVKAMRPMVLRDIAQQLGLHESTISRATKQKYAQTPWGTIELKQFFSTALQTDDGEATSATAVRSLIAKLVSEEPPHKPLSDSKIAEKLAAQGVVIARRTVAKYREAEGIEPAIMRKARAALNAP
ncbi:RNA polymerase factor sigma-54 [Achromobacter sp. F4_2707]|uniref:RNA polymerase factor sigma-54 n=1 Tax=Achromobacter sp. F4_2707 TaxID=3114286 RepID=UPI0039C6EF00